MHKGFKEFKDIWGAVPVYQTKLCTGRAATQNYFAVGITLAGPLRRVSGPYTRTLTQHTSIDESLNPTCSKNQRPHPNIFATLNP